MNTLEALELLYFARISENNPNNKFLPVDFEPKFLLFGDTHKLSLRSKIIDADKSKKYFSPEMLQISLKKLDLLRQEEVMVAVTTNTSIDILSLQYGAISEMGSMAISPNSRNKILIGYSEDTLDKKSYIHRGPLQLIKEVDSHKIHKFSISDFKRTPFCFSKKRIPKGSFAIKEYKEFINSKTDIRLSKELGIQIKNEKAILISEVMFLIYCYVLKNGTTEKNDLIKNIIIFLEKKEIDKSKILFINSYLINQNTKDQNKTKALLELLINILEQFSVFETKEELINLNINHRNHYKKIFKNSTNQILHGKNFEDKLNLCFAESFKQKFGIEITQLSEQAENRKSDNYFDWSFVHGKTEKGRSIYKVSASHKTILKFIVKYLESKIEFSKNSFAYQSNKDIVGNAKNHIDKKSWIKIDIKSFFPSIKFKRIKNMLKKYLEFSDSEINLIEKACFLDGKLAVGLSSSPILSEIFCLDLDKKLNEILSKYSWTRYADDITISSKNNISKNNFKQIISNVKKILKEYDLEINTNKTEYYYFEDKKLLIKKENQNPREISSVKITGIIVYKNTIDKNTIKPPMASNRKYKKLTKLYNDNIKDGNTKNKFQGLYNWLKYINENQLLNWEKNYPLEKLAKK